MIDSFVRETLLDPGNITEDGLASVLGTAFGQGTDGGDCYFQFICQEGWSLEDGLVKSASFNIERGVGIRVISGEQTGFAYSDELLRPALVCRNRRAGVATRGKRILRVFMFSRRHRALRAGWHANHCTHAHARYR